ncbi:MAG TPA: hypothetical protein VHV77_08840 [Pirellulales bacterium]|nr:hypothetical protein [Pirellulales bacterium]
MASVTFNYGLPISVEFICNVAINWAVARKRGTAVSTAWSGSTASAPPARTALIPANTFAAGDLIEWAADVFAPAGAATAYTLTVTVSQGAKSAASTQTGSVDGGGVQTDQGSWTCA